MVADYRRRFWVALALTVPVLALSPFIQGLFTGGRHWTFPGALVTQFLLASGVYFYGGWPFLTGIVDELRTRRPGMMTLIALAITVAYGYSALVTFGVPGDVFFWETATLIDVMLLGHWIEMRSVMGASQALEALVALMPAEAHRIASDGSIRDVPISSLQPGDLVLVKPGEKIPVDGTVVEGRTTVNQALLTGESRPVEKGEGANVIGGSVNGESTITVRVEKTGEASYLAQVVQLVRAAQESRSQAQDLADRAAQALTLIALASGSATLAVWLLVGEPFTFALARMVTVMVITCPHALGLAIPLVVAVSTALGARAGMLVRDRSAFERARCIQAVVFDKTGTLTEGRFGVSDVIPLGDASEDELLSLAAALESRSEHPIARGILEAAAARRLSYPAPAEFRAIPGRGAQAAIGGRLVRIVSPSYLTEKGIQSDDPRVLRAQTEGKTVVFVLSDDRVIGAIALADIIRPTSREAIARLKAMGVRVMMLTGDADAVAAWVAKALALDEYFAGVLPDQKASRVSEIRHRGLVVAMVGDGINDAPALADADIGIAIGASTEVAIESADVVLVRSDPRDVVELIELSRAAYAKMVQNLAWATGYNAVAIPLAAGALFTRGVVLSPAAGAVLMSLSTVIVAINAQLLARARR